MNGGCMEYRRVTVLLSMIMLSLASEPPLGDTPAPETLNVNEWERELSTSDSSFAYDNAIAGEDIEKRQYSLRI
jgi:hypothetical protein